MKLWIVLAAAAPVIAGSAVVSVSEDRPLESFRSAADCADCHVFIAAEWSQSAHANAAAAGLQVLERLPAAARERLRRYYVPTAVLTSSASTPPDVRSVFAERGVDCIACHMDSQYRMHGTSGLAAPHKVVRNDALQSVEACTPCHGQGDELDQVAAWEASGLAGGEVHCQSCHMPDVRRQLVQHWALAELPERSSHDHFFRAASDPAFLETAVTLTTAIDDDEVAATLQAGVIGHDFPGIAFRQLVLTTRGLDPQEATLWSEQELIDGMANDNRLTTGETRRYAYPRRNAAKVEAVLIYRRAPGLDTGSIEVARATGTPR